jgi:hypothetical protein
MAEAVAVDRETGAPAGLAGLTHPGDKQALHPVEYRRVEGLALGEQQPCQLWFRWSERIRRLLI